MDMDNYSVTAELLKALAHPERLRLLAALRSSEECVCHLTALLHQRQAYVSQQLMFLRKAELIQDRKDGLRVYYRIKDLRVLDVLDAANLVAGVKSNPATSRLIECSCPKCEKIARAKKQRHTCK